MFKKLSVFLVIFSLACFPFNVKAEDTKVYDVPLAKLLNVIEKSKGTRRAVIIWRSKDKKLRKFLTDFADLENTVPGSVISISDDTNPLAVRDFLRGVPILPYKVLRAQKKTGQSINLVLRKIGADPITRWPHVLLLNEDNTVKEQGAIYIDYVVDFIVTQN